MLSQWVGVLCRLWRRSQTCNLVARVTRKADGGYRRYFGFLSFFCQVLMMYMAFTTRRHGRKGSMNGVLTRKSMQIGRKLMYDRYWSSTSTTPIYLLLPTSYCPPHNSPQTHRPHHQTHPSPHRHHYAYIWSPSLHYVPPCD